MTNFWLATGCVCLVGCLEVTSGTPAKPPPIPVSPIHEERVVTPAPETRNWRQENVDRQRAERKAKEEAERAEAKQRQDEALEAKCAPDREDRRKRATVEYQAVYQRRARQKEVAEYAKTKCKSVVVKEYVRVLCDDGSPTPHWCKQYHGEHETLKCPKGAPPELADGDVPPARDFMLAGPDYSKNKECGDVPPLEERAE